MLFSFNTKAGHQVCTIEAHDKIKAKGIYKQMYKDHKVSVPPEQVTAYKCDNF